MNATALGAKVARRLIVARDTAAVLAAFCSHAVRIRPAAVLRAADVRAHGAAAARRLAVRLGGVDVLLSGGAAGRLLLRAYAQSSAPRLSGAVRASVRAGRRRAGTADRPAGHLVGAARGRRVFVAHRPAGDGASACRSLPFRPTRRCCRPGSPDPAIRMRPTRTSCTALPISAASSPCWPIRCCWSRSRA